MTDSSQSKKAAIVLLFLILILVTGSFLLVFRQTNKVQTSTFTPPTTQTEKSGTLSFGGVDYSYSTIQSGNEYVTIFSPSLVRNDEIITTTLKQLIKTTYNDTLIQEQPSLEEKNGKSYITLSKNNTKYYFLPIKDSDGSVNSFRFFKM